MRLQRKLVRKSHARSAAKSSSLTAGEISKKMMKSLSRKMVCNVKKMLRKNDDRLVPIKRPKNSSYERIGRLSSYRRLECHFGNFVKTSKSQFGQDWLVFELLGRNQHKGFFVEFGAVNGIHNSNSHFLETELQWDGIVCEPARKWHKQLHQNRKCAVDERCVYKRSGEFLDFIETGNWMGGNTLFKHMDDDGGKREISEQYQVETVSLNDLLKEHNAPKFVDFLSIDTEGSELEILEAFDFNQWSFALLIVEHNNSREKRAAIRALLEQNGYHHLPIPDDISGVDDWYASAKTYDAFVSRYTH